MKKICFVCKDINAGGGAERVAIEVMTALCGEYEMHLVSLNCSQGDTASSLDSAIRVHILDESPFTRIRACYGACRGAYRRLLRQEHFDYVVSIATYTNFLAAAMGLGTGTRLIVCDHGALESQLDDRSITFLRRFAARFADKVVVLTDRSRAAYHRCFGTPEKKLVTIYNWVDPKALAMDPPYRTDSKRIISAGRFAPEKKFERIPAIARRVFAEFPDWHWDIYGDGELFDMVRGSIEDAGMSENVHLMGAVSNLRERYAGYAFYVLTSEREGMPLVLLEARASRLPVVSYDIISGPAEIVSDGVNGLLVPNQDEDALAKAMLRLMRDEMLRRQMSDHAYDDIEKFSKERILGEWRALFG